MSPNEAASVMLLDALKEDKKEAKLIFRAMIDFHYLDEIVLVLNYAKENYGKSIDRTITCKYCPEVLKKDNVCRDCKKERTRQYYVGKKKITVHDY